MPKVFEYSGLSQVGVTPAHNTGKVHLRIKGDGMFVIRSVWRLDDNRDGVRNDVYYTRAGDFTYSAGYLLDEFGGRLQAVTKTKTQDLFFGQFSVTVHKPNGDTLLGLYKALTNMEWPTSSRLGEFSDITFASNREVRKMTVENKPNDYLAVIGEPTGNSIQIIGGLNEPKAAKYITGRTLENRWTGKVLDSNIPSNLVVGELEQLKASKYYDLGITSLTSTPQNNTTTKGGWSFALWSRCCTAEADNAETFQPVPAIKPVPAAKAVELKGSETESQVAFADIAQSTSDNEQGQSAKQGYARSRVNSP